MTGGPDDHYAVLGVPRGATPSEIRRAYRLLALRLHPDRAGDGSTEQFQRVSLAYHVLIDPAARSAYDVATAPRPAPARSASRPRAHDGVPDVHVIARLAAPLRTLVARGIARERGHGLVELVLLAEEVRTGGHAALGVPMRVACPTCGGCATKDRLWCVRCEFEGAIVDDVTIALAIPPGVPDGTTFTIRLDDMGGAAPLRVRVRHADLAANW